MIVYLTITAAPKGPPCVTAQAGFSWPSANSPSGGWHGVVVAGDCYNPSGPSGHLPLHRGGFGWVQTLQSETIIYLPAFRTASEKNGMIQGMFVNNLFQTLKLKFSRATLMRLICPRTGEK